MDFVEILGYVAAFCTTVAFLPQAIKTWKSKSARDLSLPMFLSFTFGVALWLVYGFVIQSGPVIASNMATIFLAGTILYHKIKFG